MLLDVLIGEFCPLLFLHVTTMSLDCPELGRIFDESGILLHLLLPLLLLHLLSPKITIGLLSLTFEAQLTLLLVVMFTNLLVEVFPLAH